MPNDLLALVTILGMALVTYLPRAGGIWLMGLVTLSRCVEAWLRSIPGSVLVALVAPTVFASSVAETLAALATVLVALRTRNVLLAMMIGVGVAWVLRMVI